MQRKGGAEGKESSALSFEHKRLSFLSSLEILEEMGSNVSYIGENGKGQLKAFSLRMSYEGLGRWVTVELQWIQVKFLTPVLGGSQPPVTAGRSKG